MMEQNELWGEILDRLEEQYGEIEVQKLTDTREDDTGQKIISEIKRVEVDTPAGKLRVELVESPLILDKKTHYSHTAGAHTNVEYVLSETEKTQKIKAMLYNEETGEWEERKI